MTKKEAQEILDELNTVRPEMLNEKAKRLFEAIMKIADERDKAKNIINKLEKFIEEEIELYTVELTEKNINTLGYTAPIKGVYKEIYNILQELKDVDKK